jgi:hypothetical protein
LARNQWTMTCQRMKKTPRICTDQPISHHAHTLHQQPDREGKVTRSPVMAATLANGAKSKYGLRPLRFLPSADQTFQCPENRPVCHNCGRLKLDCKYPTEGSQQENSLLSVPPVLDRSQLQSTPTLFNLTDMRLFHHFLMICYPHVPLGNEEVWVTDIASFAHSVTKLDICP